MSDANPVAPNPAQDHLIQICREILALKGFERTEMLLAWYRSPHFYGACLLLDTWVGALHREAHQTMKRTLASDRPAMRWMRAGKMDRTAPAIRGHHAICRALRIDPAEPTAGYATWPFRLIRDDGQVWIAGAVGCPHLLSGDPSDLYAELDITDVIAWNPVTGAVRLLGDSGDATVKPYDVADRVVTYAEGYSFFRAWADARAERAALYQAAKRGGWAHPVSERRDGELPGIIIVGDVSRALLPLTASVIEAGPGVDPKLLQKAIYRQANLPRVQHAKAA